MSIPEACLISYVSGGQAFKLEQGRGTKDVEERVLQAEELVLVVRHDVRDVKCCVRRRAVLWRKWNTRWGALGEEQCERRGLLLGSSPPMAQRLRSGHDIDGR